VNTSAVNPNQAPGGAAQRAAGCEEAWTDPCQFDILPYASHW
jgi:hypothetical protein